MIFRLLQWLDTWCHRLHLPKFLFKPICDAYENRLLAPIDQNATSSSGSSVQFTFKKKRHDET